MYYKECDYKVTAIIPARAGSKRLPGKNYRLFAGKPLVSWTIELAKKCDYIDKIIISTDDPQVIAIGEKYECKIHHRKPKDALDHVNLMQVIPDFIQEDCLIILLQPTSPLRNMEDIETGFGIYSPDHSVISVFKPNPYTLILNGAVYITHISILQQYRNFANPIYYLMPKERSIDIDTEEDWRMAEKLFQK
jgi:CMP-N-acetylneuraminic acid synthetase